MNKLITVTTIVAASLMVSSCMNNQEVGTATGAVLGGAIGSTIGKGHGRTAAIIGGAVIGSMIGSDVGKSMDRTDQKRMAQALETVPSNQPYVWHNPDSGNQYTVVPTQTVITSSGQPCREYTTEAIIGGKKQQVYGKACRDASGAWKIVS